MVSVKQGTSFVISNIYFIMIN